MLLRKKEFLRRSINDLKYSEAYEAMNNFRFFNFFLKPSAGKEGGQIGCMTGLFITLFLGVMLCAVLQLEHYRAASLYLEDALAASNLASAVVDVQEYGISHSILIARPEEAYKTYQWAVRSNLNLNAAWEGQAGSLVQGPVGIVQYIVYNVRGDEVTVYHFDENGQMTQWQETLGNVAAPNGIPVESTSVYSEITFEAGGFLGVTVKAHKGNLADISR